MSRGTGQMEGAYHHLEVSRGTESTAGTVASATGMGERQYPVTAVRAIAATLVMVFHAYQHGRYGPDAVWPLHGVWHKVLMATGLCVDLFFALSGFLLGLPYARAVLGKGPWRNGRVFLLRRAARLLPLYFAVVLLMWGLTNRTLPGDWQDLALHLTFTQVYSDEKIFYTNGPAWSLAVEIHFCLLLALLGWAAQRWLVGLASWRRKLAVMYGAVTLLILLGSVCKLWAVYVVHAEYERWSYWYNPAVKLDVFAIGLGFAVLTAHGWRLHGKPTQYAVGLSGVGLLAFVAATLPEDRPVSTWWHTLFAFGSMLLIAAVILAAMPSAKILTWRPLVWTGTVSYSLYLWQEPVLRLLDNTGLLPTPGLPVTFPVTAGLLSGLSLFVAWLSHRLIEQTGMKILAAFDREGRPRDYYAPEEISDDAPATPGVRALSRQAGA